jgi:purine-binding chemotaxis protein CheW
MSGNPGQTVRPLTQERVHPSVPKVGELLTFHCGGRAYAIDIMDVREIRSWSEPTPLPHTSDYMRGIVNLRGSILPIIDLARRLGAACTKNEDRNVIIVIEDAGNVQGLLVEGVSDIVKPDANQMQPVPDMSSSDGALFCDQLFVMNDLMIQVLDVVRLLHSCSER